MLAGRGLALCEKSVAGTVKLKLTQFRPVFCKGMGSMQARQWAPPVVMGTEEMMKKKAHGTCVKAVQESLKWNVDRENADKICCFNRHYAEHSGYAFGGRGVTWLKEVDRTGPTIYYDSVHGKSVFKAPIGRAFDEFLAESKAHGWPSFRDDEVDWDSVRVLPNGETITVDGVHLGHNLPDGKGNRYCINLICIAGSPEN